jgi:flagellar M-ring protein FliF
MKEKLIQYKNQFIHYWQQRSMAQKGMLIGSFIFIIILAGIIAITSKPQFVPLFSGLSPEEIGQIKESLDAKGVSYELANGGTVINVSEKEEDTLKVQLAAEGLPKSGNIDYSFFSENAGFGMTDNEFNVLEREAMQTELSGLINSIDGVKNSTVMINTPSESVWVSDQDQTATASVVLGLKPGYKLEQNQINALYHLVSKSVPSLPVDNIVIMDQYFNYFNVNDSNQSNSSFSAYEEQRKIKQDIEQDIQRQVQKVLGTVIGHNNVIATVTADVDFTQEQREETLVEPVDEENMEGIQISVERIRENYEGEGAAAGGTPIGEDDIPGNAEIDGDDGEYERVEERINNEVNRIRKEIVESPYEVRDLGIQVMIEPPERNGELPARLEGDIEQLLSSIVRTTISDNDDDPLTQQDINEKIFVSSYTFNGNTELPQEMDGEIPYWYYLIGGFLLVIILLLLFLLIRKNRNEEEQEVQQEEYHFEEKEVFDAPDINDSRGSENTVRLEQLEKMAKEKPDEFAKLLRTWLSED